MNRTKIICTAGPSVESEEKILSLAQKGMSIIRLNCSHGTYKTRLKHIQTIRKVEKKLNKPLGVMLDLQGPKLRVGVLPKPFRLHSEDIWTLSCSDGANYDKKIIPVSFKGLSQAVTVGGRVYMDDGLIRTEVVKKGSNYICIKVIHGGTLESRKGINIPYYKGKLPILSKKDKEDLIWGLEHHVDFVAISFVRNAKDILTLRRFIGRHQTGHQPLLIAKIEKPEAVENMDAIISVSDGILVARGDLGIELSLEKVPVVQKQLIEKCREHKVPVIVATQMLDSMRLYPIPTRAEVSDVASAIYQGTDAVLLTGETSTGNYPDKATNMLNNIIAEVEEHMVQKVFRKTPEDFGVDDYREAFLFNVMQLADDIDAKAIVMLTKRGVLTKRISKLHPKQPIFSLASNLYSYRQNTLFWGVFPIETPLRKADKRIKHGIKILKNKKVIKKSDRLIFVYWDYQQDNLNLKIVEC